MNGWGLYILPPLFIGGMGVAGIYIAQKFDYDETLGLGIGLMAGSLVSGVYMKVQVSGDAYREALRTDERNAQ